MRNTIEYIFVYDEGVSLLPFSRSSPISATRLHLVVVTNSPQNDVYIYIYICIYSMIIIIIIKCGTEAKRKGDVGGGDNKQGLGRGNF